MKSSVNMEKEGLIRGLAFFSDVGVPIKSLTTDRHSGIKKHMRQHHSTIVHYFDVWHVAKGMKRLLVFIILECARLENIMWILASDRTCDVFR